jgi:hypothetical protein
VGELVTGNGLDAVVNIRAETGALEVINGEVGKTLAVEGAFKMLQSKRVVQNVG